MTKVHIFKDTAFELEKLYQRVKDKLLQDKFKITSEVQTDHVHHLRAEKTGVKEIIIGAVRDVELIIAGEPKSFAVIISAGAWGANIVTSGTTGYVVTTLLEGPAAIYGSLAAMGSYVRAVAYENDLWFIVNREVKSLETDDPLKGSEVT